MINNEANTCYYFAVKSLSELYSLSWLRNKKEIIINGDNDFQNAKLVRIIFFELVKK